MVERNCFGGEIMNTHRFLRPLFFLFFLASIGCPEKTPVEPKLPTSISEPLEDFDGTIEEEQDAEGEIDATPPTDGETDAEEESSDTEEADDGEEGEEGGEEGGDSESPTDTEEEPDTTEEEDGGDVKPETPWEDCDAGDVAWAKRAIQVLLGRNPTGLQEARVIARMVGETDRETVAWQLTKMAPYTARWRDFFMDEVRINRVGDKAHYDCYSSMPNTGDGGNIAEHIRDNPPGVPYPGGSLFDMSNVLASSLDLDDLTPFYRAQLFAMMSKPITGANVAALELDITRRQDFGVIFSAVYTHRGVVCAGCHNSLWGVTNNADPEKDKHWELPGLFEKAIYGESTGRDEMEVYSAFRHLGVAGGSQRPWNMSEGCGTFTSKDNISIDPANIDAYLVSAIGKTGSIWDVEAALHAGVNGLREDGLQMDPDTKEVDPNEGFAYLLATRVVNQVWQEVYGYPLTLVHYIPRNKEQRDLLLDLTTIFVEESFSLRTLLVSMLVNPLFNQLDPAEGCGGFGGYILPPVFNPWVLDEPDLEMHENSTGDGVHRKSARVLLRSIANALDWPGGSIYPNSNEEEFQKAIGVFVKDAEPGFLGVDFQGMLSWESRYGACENQKSGVDWILRLLDGMGNYQVITGEPATLRQVLIAMKDRIFTEPFISEEEAVYIASFFEIESLDIPAAELDDLQGNLRKFCGVLTESPQFLLAGTTANMNDWVPPSVVVNELDFATTCETLTGEIFAGWEVNCDEENFSLSPMEEEAP
jgi:hypothetical protein